MKHVVGSYIVGRIARRSTLTLVGLLGMATAAQASSIYTYTYDGPTAVGGNVSEVAQFSLSAPLGANASVKWDKTPNTFPSAWLGGTIKLVGAGAPANYSVDVTNFAADTNSSGQIKNWYIWGQAFLPNNVYEQAYSINSAAAGQPLGVLTAIAMDQAVTLSGSPYTYQYAFMINPSGSVASDWHETVSSVPLPSAMPMFMSALLVAGLMSRRKTSA